MADSVLAASLACQYYALGDILPSDIIAVLVAVGFSSQPPCLGQGGVGKNWHHQGQHDQKGAGFCISPDCVGRG